MNTFDLHVHSRVSDGQHDIKELLLMAKVNGLKIISITDHDSVDALEEGVSIGSDFNIRVIPGVEISAEDENRTSIHILGYGIDYKDQNLLDRLQKCQIRRIERAKKMLTYVQKLGFIVEWGDVMKFVKGNSITSPHIAKAVLNRPENKKRLGKIFHYSDFINIYLRNRKQDKINQDKLTIKEAVELIHKARGVAIWAHPIISSNKVSALEQFLQKLIKLGLDGMEILAPTHTKDDINFLHKISKKYNILYTAGSDFHECEVHCLDNRGLHQANTIGDYNSHDMATENIIPLLDKAINKIGTQKNKSRSNTI